MSTAGLRPNLERSDRRCECLIADAEFLLRGKLRRGLMRGKAVKLCRDQDFPRLAGIGQQQFGNSGALVPCDQAAERRAVSGTVVDEEADDAPKAGTPASNGEVTLMSMPDAKRALAAFYGVEPGAIEIVIRG